MRIISITAPAVTTSAHADSPHSKIGRKHNDPISAWHNPAVNDRRLHEYGCRAQRKKQSLLKQKTQDIGEYDPDAGLELSDSKVRVDDPILGPLQAYGPTIEKVSKMAIDRQIQFFHVENDRYPSYDEFMEQIIKRYNIRLPVLPGKHKYQYDVENHKLAVVKPPADEKK